MFFGRPFLDILINRSEPSGPLVLSPKTCRFLHDLIQSSLGTLHFDPDSRSLGDRFMRQIHFP